MSEIILMDREELKEHFLKSTEKRVWVTSKSRLKEFEGRELKEKYPNVEEGYILNNLVENSPLAVSRVFVMIDKENLGKEIYLDEDILDSISVEYYRHRQGFIPDVELDAKRVEEIESLQEIIGIMMEKDGREYKIYRAKGEID